MEVPKRILSRERAEKALQRLGKLSSTTTRLLSRLRRRDCEAQEVAELIEGDPVLSSQILQMANSAAFGRSQAIDSIRHALTRVGLNGIRKFALSRSITNLFSRCTLAPSFSLTRFNVHSVAVATLMEIFEDELPLTGEDGAFLAGLFHDAGRLLIAVGMPDEYESVLASSCVSGLTLHETEQELLGVDHAELSGLAVTHWGLGDAVWEGVRYHHDPRTYPIAGKPADTISLSLAVQAADAFANAIGIGPLPRLRNLREQPSIRIEGFEFDQTPLVQRFEAEWIHTCKMFQ